MAKSKKRNPSSSAAQRREQVRQDRSRGAPSPAVSKNKRKRAASKRSPWLIVGGTLILIAAIVGLFIFLSKQQSSSTTSGPTGTPVDATTFKQVTNIDPGLLSQTGTGGLPNPFKAAPGSPSLLTGPTGKPEVFYYGAEFCPYCAAERWGIVVALSRFGTFHTLRETTSSGTDVYSNTPTFTFYQSSYSSSYLDFVPLENEDRQQNVMQTPTADEQQILTRYNVSGYPFMDIGDRYLVTVPSYDPGVLRTNPKDPNSQPLSQQDIAGQLSTGNKLSKNVLGTANYLTAAICSITRNQPSNVCSDPSIQHIEASLSSTGQSNPPSGDSSLIAVAGPPAADVRRKQGLI